MPLSTWNPWKGVEQARDAVQLIVQSTETPGEQMGRAKPGPMGPSSPSSLASSVGGCCHLPGLQGSQGLRGSWWCDGLKSTTPNILGVFTSSITSQGSRGELTKPLATKGQLSEQCLGIGGPCPNPGWLGGLGQAFDPSFCRWPG